MNSPTEQYLGAAFHDLVAEQPFTPDVSAIGHLALRDRRRMRIARAGTGVDAGSWIHDRAASISTSYLTPDGHAVMQAMQPRQRSKCVAAADVSGEPSRTWPTRCIRPRGESISSPHSWYVGQAGKQNPQCTQSLTASVSRSLGASRSLRGACGAVPSLASLPRSSVASLSPGAAAPLCSLGASRSLGGACGAVPSLASLPRSSVASLSPGAAAPLCSLGASRSLN